MPYYVGIIGDRVESLNTTLPPEEAQARYVKFKRVESPMTNPCYVDNVFRERTAEEIETINQAKARLDALNRNVFSKLEIRRALRELGQESVLDGLLSGNAIFKSDWLDAQEIDLSDDMTAQALASVSVDIDQIKLKIAGV